MGVASAKGQFVARRTLPTCVRAILTLVRNVVFALVLLHAQGVTAAGQREPDTASESLLPGEFTWAPDLSPAGPLLLVVSLSDQRVHVYRNGVLIGVSTASTGTGSHPTPVGVYRILERRTRHRSNLYDAEMPYMHRLT
jgi:hypothetical protein